MKSLFNMDSPVFIFLGRVGDLMILNFIFMLTCFPVITIGASLTALYTVSLKMVRDEESYIIRDYLKAFRKNWKQSSLVWLFVILTGIVLYLYFSMVSTLSGSLASICTAGLFAICFLLLMLLVYVFASLAKFENTLRNTFFFSAAIMIKHLPYTLIMLVVTAAPPIITLSNDTIFTYGILLWLLFGFSAIAYVNSIFLRKVFDLYIPKEEEPGETMDP